MKTSNLITALVLIVAAAAYRVGAVFVPDLSNLSPIMALAFCGAVYFRNRWLWLVPFAALSLSDAYLNYYYAKEYGFNWPLSGFVARTAGFGAALFIEQYVPICPCHCSVIKIIDH